MAQHETHPDTTIEKIVKDCKVARDKYYSSEWCFTHVTVQFLLDTIKELKAELNNKG